MTGALHAATADLLESAADRVEAGWMQMSGVSEPFGACAGNALFFEYLEDGRRYDAEVLEESRQALIAAAGLSPANQGEAVLESIWAWNDDPATTKQAVLDAMRGAAKDQRRLADEA